MKPLEFTTTETLVSESRWRLIAVKVYGETADGAWLDHKTARNVTEADLRKDWIPRDEHEAEIARLKAALSPFAQPLAVTERIRDEQAVIESAKAWADRDAPEAERHATSRRLCAAVDRLTGRDGAGGRP